MRYIGNKTRLLKNIKEFIEENKIKGKIFCDIFAGTSSVGDNFKSEYKIISNDLLTSSYCIAKAKLLNNKIPDFKKFIKKFNVSPFDYLNNKKYEYQSNFFVTNQYSPKGNRMFFTEENAIIIDGMRLEIEEHYKEALFSENEYYFLIGSLLESVTKFSNTSGTYEAFLKKWDSRALKKFEIKPLEMATCETLYDLNEVYNEDANQLIRKIEGEILYIDPPYTITEYSSAYHVLETIARYDYPKISGLTARRLEGNYKSKYTRKNEALNAFEDLIRQANFKHIIISYSNQSIIPIDELIDMLSKYSIDDKVIKKEILYREYKNIKSSKKGDKLFELLLYIKKPVGFMKSPLNYSGSKDKIMPQIYKFFPPKISTFIDVMGGAFNVGINVVADEVIYNEYNPFVFELIKTIIEMDSNDIISYVEKQINKYGLTNGASEAYKKFRDMYNYSQTKKPLDLFILTMYCFQNQIRFNGNLEFNTPVGNCAYNQTIKSRLFKFKPRTNKVIFTNLDFTNIKFENYDKDALFYFDPPYFITNATYNDGKRGFKGWDADLETKLLDYITDLHSKGYRFLLSNVIEHKGKTNHILKDWIETHNFKVIEIEGAKRKEVVIFNYDLEGGIR